MIRRLSLALVVALALLRPAPAHAAVAFVQAASGTSSSVATVSAQFSSTPTAGNTIIACLHIFLSGGAPTGTVADDGSNSYASVQTDTQTNSRFECHIAINISGVASHDVTWTAASGTPSATLSISEWSGTPTTSVLNASNINSIGNTSAPAGTAINAGVNGMHVTFLGWDSFSITHTPGSGWTEAIEVTSGGFLNQAISYRAAVNGVSQTPGATLSSNSGFGRYIHMVIAESGGGGGGTVSKLPLLGVGL